MEELRLCESDYRFMLVLWEHAPISSKELVEVVARKLGWKKSTTYTVLKKLSERGFVENVGKTVSVLIPKEKVQEYESERFVARAFEGSLPQFLVSFLGGKKISQQEAAELKRLIDEHQEG